ncbi:MAG TPA: amidohydrolase family protein [Phenylobacterium sp.]|nr:amidohydrolase family protein [Phenylobacterium sp.]
MARFDTVIQGGRIIDGTGAAGYFADLGVRDGVIAAIGNLKDAVATEWIDARGKIVAPGHVSAHSHYDVSLFWDPYCSNSGENGITTVLNANCGFGLAPVRPADRERTMLMLENTEQIPVSHQRAALAWDWTDFPSYLERLRALPKGVNVLTFLPVNPLLIYVMGVDAAKTRRPTAEEMAEIHRLIHEAMDAGAIGVSMSVMGAGGNTHVDFDGSPMPTDSLHPDDVVEIARALAERGEGTVQVLSQIVGFGDLSLTERVAAVTAGTGARVLHNIFLPLDAIPDGVRNDLAWLEGLRARGGDVTASALLTRGWTEGGIEDIDTSMGQLPAVREIVRCPDRAAVLRLISDPAFVARLSRQYVEMGESTGSAGLEHQIVLSVGEHPELQPFVGMRLAEVAALQDKAIVATLLDLGVRSGLELLLKSPPIASVDPHMAATLLSHPAVLAGTSDGGAHTKVLSLGQYCTDLLIWLVRETGLMSLEEMHFQLSLKTARALNLFDRGALLPGLAADILIYDLDALYYDLERLEVVHDMPGGDWRRRARAGGYDRILVNGVTTHLADRPTGASPGQLLRVTSARRPAALAAE